MMTNVLISVGAGVGAVCLTLLLYEVAKWYFSPLRGAQVAGENKISHEGGDADGSVVAPAGTAGESEGIPRPAAPVPSKLAPEDAQDYLEPWTVGTRAHSNMAPEVVAPELLGRDGTTIFECWYSGLDDEERGDYARRIAACVNFFAGIPTDLVEQLDPVKTHTVPPVPAARAGR